MKKSLTIISAIIVTSAVLFTSCSVGKLTIKDSAGEKHILCTDENGNQLQDNYGNVYEKVTDKDGKKVTEIYSFPEIVSNKSMSKIENCWVKVDVPKGWKATASNTIMRLRHSGDCVEVNQNACGIDFNSYFNTSIEEKYDNCKKSADKLYSLSSDICDIREFETEICGVKAKAISYRVASEKTSFYNYFMTNGYFVYSINAVVYDNCYKNSEELVNYLETFITMKNVVNQTTVTTTAE